MPVLKLQSKAGIDIVIEPTTVNILEPQVLGRDEDCTYQIVGSKISRKHCLLHYDGDNFFIQDLSTRHGTHVILGVGYYKKIFEIPRGLTLLKLGTSRLLCKNIREDGVADEDADDEGDKPSPRILKLEVVAGPDAPRKFKARLRSVDECSVGRAAECRVRLENDAAVARVQAKLLRKRGQRFLFEHQPTDKGRSLKVVGGADEGAERYCLRDGDALKLGHYVLSVIIGKNIKEVEEKGYERRDIDYGVAERLGADEGGNGP